MLSYDSITRCVEAFFLIDDYLKINQKSGSYSRWLERYQKSPAEHTDCFLFGKVVQAMFSGGMNGKVVDAWMPRMEEAFYNWDVARISKMTEQDVELLASSGKVIANLGKLKAIVFNAKIVLKLTCEHGSFGGYIVSFESVSSLSKDIVTVQKFRYLGPVTTEDFLRNIGVDTAKPDRHLTRWLERMAAIKSEEPTERVLEVICTIADTAKVRRARFDSATYLFCADRDDVLVDKGVCGDIPKCIRCPVVALCPKKVSPRVKQESSRNVSRSAPSKKTRISAEPIRSSGNTVWNARYPGMSLEEIKVVNPFATKSWLDQNFGENGSRERREHIKDLFAGNAAVDNVRINSFGGNKGKYVAFRAIVHDYASWENGELCATTKIKML